MIQLIRKNNTLMFEIDNSLNCERDYTGIQSIPQPVIKKENVLTYNSWLDAFEMEVDDIIDEYIEFIYEISYLKGYNCIFNRDQFSLALKELIYKTSYNRFKYYQCLIET